MDAPQAGSNSQAVVTLVDDFVSILKAGCAMPMTNHRAVPPLATETVAKEPVRRYLSGIQATCMRKWRADGASRLEAGPWRQGMC
ncbi:MAG: hypothetical protein E5V40_24195 [Mesorhizobium sp.]|nr:MAG: hypothetical protein E5V40_24195 [Mesorhizobium sp.]